MENRMTFPALGRTTRALGLMAALALVPITAPLAQASTQAEINAALRADREIDTGLFALAVADAIRDTCPSIEARDWRARGFVLTLYNRARGMGFSRDQIRAYLRDSAEQDRMRALVMRYFDERGVRPGAPETFCALGQSEIASGSQTGALLRVR